MGFYFLGIDQTGARDSKGQPKPLPSCLIFEDQIHFFYLKTLSKSHIVQQITFLSSKKGKTKDKIPVGPSESHRAVNQIIICLDCVIGLPKSLGLKWRKAVNSTLSEPGYGRETARIFFERILNKTKSIESSLPSIRPQSVKPLNYQVNQAAFPRRECEIRLKANSVFQSHPFQKNIQTGTFRLWKELAQSPNDFYAPAVEPSPKQSRSKKQGSDQPIPIFEGYPSHSWRIIFGVKARDPENLNKLMGTHFPKLKWTKSHQTQVSRDSNLGDALVLALTLLKLQSELSKTINTKSSEGFILSERLSK